MKTGLVLEGGAMQGMYTAGVLDVFMENGITFDGVIGVSAGALFGVNFLSGQIGRAIRYNKKYNRDPHYLGIWSLLTSGNIINTEYAYERVPKKLDPFDNEAFQKSGVPFYAVITNIRTGLPEYVLLEDVFAQMDQLRASGSMPFVSTPVEIEGELYLDGAITDSIPYKKMQELGYDRLVVVLTKSSEYVKAAMPPLLCRAFYHKRFPLFEERVRIRHEMYNKQMADLMELQKTDAVEVIRPSEPMYVKKTEKNPEKMEKLYQLGRRDAANWLKNKKEKGEKSL